MAKEEDKIHKIIHHQRTFGEKASDKISELAGSWAFILFLIAFLIIWVLINVYAWIEKLDPYPFMLLNLVLAVFNVILAPIILMSQNRQAQRDRLKFEYDYKINKKAEQEIREIKNLLQKQMKR